MKKICFFLLLFFASTFNAQQKKKTVTPKGNSTQKLVQKKVIEKGYSITINTDNTDDATLYLKLFKGNIKTTYAIDSAKVTSQNQKIIFKTTNPIFSFPVVLSTKDKENNVMLFLKNGAKMDVVLKGNQLADISTNDPLNRDFLAYQRENNIQNKIALAKKILSDYNDVGLKTFFNFEFVRLQIRDRNSLLNAIKEADNAIDFSDKNIPLMPNAYVFLNTYFETTGNYFASVDHFLKGLDCKNGNLKFYVDWMVKNLEFRNSLAEDVKPNYQYILQNYLSKPDCETKLKDEITKINFNLKEGETVPLGKVLPNFKMKSFEGEIYDFQKYLDENKNISILIFYDPQCSHCIETVPAKTLIIKGIEEKYNVKFNKIAILYDGSHSQWQNFITTSHLENWLNASSVPGNKTIGETLSIGAVPKFFILDENGIVLVKDLNEQLLINEIEKRKAK